MSSLDSNLGLFRNWLLLFFENRKDVTTQPYLIIRDLPSQGMGLPLDIMFFITTTNWMRYEEIQSDIFEEIMITLKDFGLKQFQCNIMLNTNLELH